MGLETTLLKTGAVVTGLVVGGIFAENSTIGFNALADDVAYLANKYNPKPPVKKSVFSKKKPVPTKAGITQEMITNGVGIFVGVCGGVAGFKTGYNGFVKGVPVAIERAIVTKDVVTTLATDPDDLEFEEDDE